jgi:hypothetical protein
MKLNLIAVERYRLIWGTTIKQDLGGRGLSLVTRYPRMILMSNLFNMRLEDYQIRKGRQ